VVAPRGYTPQTSPFGATTTISHAIIGMGIVLQHTPLYFDCANEAGLCVAGLNFPGYAQYETAPLSDKTNVASWEFPLWVAANFSTVDDVEAALAHVAIVDRPLTQQYPTSLLHWIVADATRSIAVEYTRDGMHVYHDDADVLANQPEYGYHAENLRSYLTLTNDIPATAHWGKAALAPYGTGAGMRGLPGDYYSPSRFVRAAFFNAHYPEQAGEKSNVVRLFHTLAAVSMIDGAAKMADDTFERTIYTGGFSSATKTYYYNTYDSFAVRHVSLTDVDTASDQLIEVFPEAV
jgi:penicillin V acylase-like amidase (Ntn superfamily)